MDDTAANQTILSTLIGYLNPAALLFWRRRQTDLEVPLLAQKNNSSEAECPQNVLEHKDLEQNPLDEFFIGDDVCEEADIQPQQDPECPRWTGISRVIKLVGRQSFYLYIGCLVLVIRLPFSLSIPHFVSATLGALGRADFTSARTNILLLLIMGTIDAILDFWCVVLFGLTSLNIVKCLRLDLFACILKQDMAFFDSSKTPDLASRLNSDCGAVGADLSWFFRFSIESIVRITGISTYMFIRSPKLAACVVSVIPVVAILNKKYGDWLRRNAADIQDALADANASALEAMSCIRTVFSLSSEELEKGRYFRAIETLYKASLRQLYAQGLYYMVVSTFLINTCVQSLLLWVGTMLVEENQMNAEVLIAFMFYQSQLQNEALNLFNSFTSLMKSTGAGEKLFSLLDRKTPAPGFGSPDVMQGPFSPPDLWDIHLRNVGFKYPTRKDHTVLYDLHLDIPKGRTMALIGKSGCGKSTIFALLQRFYDPDSGAIFIDGKDLRGIPLSGYRRKIGIVQQDPVLFMGSIRENIAYGYTEATNEEVEDAARLANAHDFIQSFAEKYETQVGERGVQLSGGQKQRIAIARAVIRRPSLLLLDEATSALDSESEKIVQLALDDLLSRKGDMTVLVIAHRLQTVRNADCIAVIDRGRVVEKGSHTELMKVSEGIYRRMVERTSESGALAE